jgi:hypothetical protein
LTVPVAVIVTISPAVTTTPVGFTIAEELTLTFFGGLALGGS